MRIKNLVSKKLCGLLFFAAFVANALPAYATELGVSRFNQHLYESTKSRYNSQEGKEATYSFYEIYHPYLSLHVQFNPQFYQLLKQTDAQPRPEGVRSLRKELYDYQKLAASLSAVLPLPSLPMPAAKATHFPHVSYEIDATGGVPMLKGFSVLLSKSKDFFVPFFSMDVVNEKLVVLVAQTSMMLDKPALLQQGIEAVQRAGLQPEVQMRLRNAGLTKSYELASTSVHPMQHGWKQKLKQAFSTEEREDFRIALTLNYASFLRMALILKKAQHPVDLDFCESLLSRRILFL